MKLIDQDEAAWSTDEGGERSGESGSGLGSSLVQKVCGSSAIKCESGTAGISFAEFLANRAAVSVWG